MARKNTRNKKNTRRQGRPQGYVPSRLAHVKAAYDGEGVELSTMRSAVEYVELMEIMHGMRSGTLTNPPLYRMTAAAFKEADSELTDAISSGELSWTLDDLVHNAGVVTWEDQKPFVGFSWHVIDDSVFVQMMTSYNAGAENVLFHFEATEDMPDFKLAVVTAGLSDPEVSLLGLRLLAVVRAILARLIIGGGSKVVEPLKLGAESAVRHASSKQGHLYEVRSVAECATGRPGSGGHAGWHLQHRSYTRGFYRKNGTWVDGYVRGKHLPERPRVVTGTTVRDRHAA
ncbi:hypothetical protein ABE10_11365 [Bacillus toyonensis]|nr:hypothetical protein [Bacillus toyonensis]